MTEELGKKRIIEVDRGVIVAADVPLEHYGRLVQDAAPVKGVEGFKVGFALALAAGLPKVDVDAEEVFYNHRSAGTDIPATGKQFAEAIAEHPWIGGVILTPLAGPMTQKQWMREAKSRGLEVVLEPFIDQDGLLDVDGGPLRSEAIYEMVKIGIENGADSFILPEGGFTNQLRESLVRMGYEVHVRNEDHTLPDYTPFKELTLYDVLPLGLPDVVNITKQYTDKPVICDLQKMATTWASDGGLFAKLMKEAGVDATILFPQAGPITEQAWIEALKSEGIATIMGGEMTHAGYKASDGGFLTDHGAAQMYLTAAAAGVQDFVVPGNKPEAIRLYREMIEERGIQPTLWSPGFGKMAQGGNVAMVVEIAGKRWYAICGRASYNPNKKADLADVTTEERQQSLEGIAKDLGI